MKILTVNMRLDAIRGGGTAERTFQMSRFLSKTGVECTILTTNLDLSPERIDALVGVDVITLPCLIERFFLPKLSFEHIIQIKNIVKDVDLILIMNHWTFINAVVYAFARKFKKPYVVCPSGALRIFGRSRFFKQFYNLLIGKQIIRNADGHIAVSKNELPQFQDYGVDPEKVSVIPNGIDMTEYLVKDDESFYKKYSLPPNPFILFVGRLNLIKGPDLLIQAFSKIIDNFPNYHLVFAGHDEGMLSELKRFAAEHNIINLVHFIGHVDKTEKSIVYNAADILVVPSRHEAMSIVAIEAGITGTPVLITDRCGFNDLARFNGGLVVPASVEGLQKGLVAMLSNRAQLKSMGANLRKYTIENFTWDVLIYRYLNLYDKILKFKIKTQDGK